MKTYSITDTGILREMNQDYFFASDEPVGNLPNLYIVADGMGGHKAGDYASRYTPQRIVASVSRSSGHGCNDALHPCPGVREKNQLQF